MNREKWDALTETQQAQIEVACGDNFREGMVEGEAIQFTALKELREKGVNIHRWPPEVLEELNGAWNEVLETLQAAWDEVAAELAAEDESFKKTWESLQTFRADYTIWKELGYLN